MYSRFAVLVWLHDFSMRWQENGCNQDKGEAVDFTFIIHDCLNRVALFTPRQVKSQVYLCCRERNSGWERRSCHATHEESLDRGIQEEILPQKYEWQDKHQDIRDGTWYCISNNKRKGIYSHLGSRISSNKYFLWQMRIFRLAIDQDLESRETWKQEDICLIFAEKRRAKSRQAAITRTYRINT